MRIADCMTKVVQLARPEDSLESIALMMSENGFGAVPVSEGDRLIGMITDRDIVVRGVARGFASDTEVREVMSPDVKYCFENEDSEEVLRNMGELQIRRLPVLNQGKRLVGIVAIGDLSTDARAGEALERISQDHGATPILSA